MLRPLRHSYAATTSTTSRTVVSRGMAEDRQGRSPSIRPELLADCAPTNAALPFSSTAKVEALPPRAKANIGRVAGRLRGVTGAAFARSVAGVCGRRLVPGVAPGREQSHHVPEAF